MKAIHLLVTATMFMGIYALSADDPKKNADQAGRVERGPRELFNDPAVLFKWLDTDKDGKLSPAEFQRILNVSGWPGGSAGSTGTDGAGPSASAGEPPAKTGGAK